MDKVEVRAKALSQALFSLANAGCEVVEVSVVVHAVKLEGKQEISGNSFILHVWSKEAEETEEEVGKGEKLTEEEVRMVEDGKCPKCKEHLTLYKGPRVGLAINVSCDAGHIFWIPPFPWVPEYRGTGGETPTVIDLVAKPTDEEQLEEKLEESSKEE